MRINLIKLRNEKGYTQQEVADRLDISRRMYGSVETGRRNPSWEVIQRLEQFFGVPASELLAETDGSHHDK
ncbi:Cro/C1-type helix-turn-helix domain [Syntrophomonas zehnderi OL-4]|uniref:Cro/C1-type helix-turn-helix domain n=1 Tax=Syntrophomonas zehnderi OL-4 TaxID=690567 RepID=A0A0E3W2R4_9FIRM|nr:helix-turn-helix transcriptional regulator [Syntrophomonas zehnderi]CFX15565.1 Cro/C1-type helix-turn-helix domain [Syntrophomonas zehnderi OL-4]